MSKENSVTKAINDLNAGQLNRLARLQKQMEETRLVLMENLADGTEEKRNALIRLSEASMWAGNSIAQENM